MDELQEQFTKILAKLVEDAKAKKNILPRLLIREYLLWLKIKDVPISDIKVIQKKSCIGSTI